MTDANKYLKDPVFIFLSSKININEIVLTYLQQNFGDEREDDIFKLERKIGEMQEDLEEIKKGQSDLNKAKINEKYPNPKK